jgi:hypothetical protein
LAAAASAPVITSNDEDSLTVEQYLEKQFELMMNVRFYVFKMGWDINFNCIYDIRTSALIRLAL